MAEYGEWNRKGATLSEVTAKKEYGVDREFIVKGIQAGKLEYREGAICVLRLSLIRARIKLRRNTHVGRSVAR